MLVSFPNSVHSTNPKLQHKYAGPFVVIERITPVTYQVAKSLGNKSTTVHVSRLKLYNPPLNIHEKSGLESIPPTTEKDDLADDLAETLSETVDLRAPAHSDHSYSRQSAPFPPHLSDHDYF